MALWCIKDDKDNNVSTTSSSRVQSRSPDYEYDIVRPLAVKTCKKAEKVRALGYNHNKHVRTRSECGFIILSIVEDVCKGGYTLT